MSSSDHNSILSIPPPFLFSYVEKFKLELRLEMFLKLEIETWNLKIWTYLATLIKNLEVSLDIAATS